jgi:hypothetical protein
MCEVERCLEHAPRATLDAKAEAGIRKYIHGIGFRPGLHHAGAGFNGRGYDD